MSRPRTTPIGAALVITFVCFLLQPTPSAAAQDGGMLQGLWARTEAILRVFAAPHAARVSSRPDGPVAGRKADRKERQGEKDREATPPPSRYLMDVDADG